MVVKIRRIGVLIWLLVVLSGCSLIDFSPLTSITDQAAARIDAAMADLQNESADVQSILEDLQHDLIEIGVKQTISVQISDLIGRSIAKTGVEFKCSVDFLHTRVREELQRIKDQLLGRDPTERLPVLCQAVQSAIQLDLIETGQMPILEMSGYNFQLEKNIVANLQYGDGSSQDVSQYLAIQSNYFMVVNLVSMYNARLLDPVESSFATLQLRWNDQPVSTTNIIPPVIPRCETVEEKVNPGVIEYTPPHTRGDKEFDGHGPNMYASVTVASDDQRSWYFIVYLKAEETESDWTTAEGTRNTQPFYRVPDGYEFVQLLTPQANDGQYRDTNHVLDTFYPNDQGPVHHFEAFGDHDGSDAGSYTKVRAIFNQIVFRIKQVQGCRNPPLQLNLDNLRISPGLLEILKLQSE
jgi:hypothetical protein